MGEFVEKHIKSNHLYEDSLKSYRDLKNSLDTARQEARQEARIEARQETIEEIVINAAKAGLA